jgi:hypothetical protein
MRRFDYRFLFALLVLSAVWWFFLLARRCDGGRPRPTELVPAEQGREYNNTARPGVISTQPGLNTQPRQGRPQCLPSIVGRGRPPERGNHVQRLDLPG